ncbi:bifunctional diguanylate cyclase/phosphodiesterase [Shewanella sp. NIFS-20-20]|uniref:putative bifunctional diguanylate cyclase/phosphodiesterase n=1 Tax=Shewanella sp. NIFS-20-20 TaxID=2853806 RepID=UPI001C459C85|nr:EAL domain-containing protein [Shewanella sp. NIFS-20-20]MBV7314476.1 EAL domain-containing protein [Shewanella sp. NIFS-20-20]
MAKPVDQQGANERLSQVQNKLIEHLQASEKRYQDLVGHLRDVVFHLDLSLQWRFINPAWEVMTGYSLTESLGRHFTEHLSPLDIDECTQGFAALLNQDSTEFNRHIQFTTVNKQQRIFDLSCRPVKDETGKFAGFTGILTDITDRVNAEKQILFNANHDFLTGVANRRLLMEHLTHEFSQSRPSACALLYIDLDNFKQVNDQFGHAIGDQLLCQVSQSLSEFVQSSTDLVARMGGDEFIVFLADLGAQGVMDHITQVTEAIHKQLSQPIQLQHLTLQITCSIGVVIIEQDQMSQSDILIYADAALYHAKNTGKNQVRFYDEQLKRSEAMRHQLAIELERAITQQEFILYFQPQVNLEEPKITKAEVLIRWQHPTQGITCPCRFIPQLEESGQIVIVGNWVFEQSCRQLHAWHQAGYHPLCLSINVSANQFNHPDFIAFVEQCLQRFQVPAHNIELELTESVAINDIDATIIKMNQLCRLGIRIALDDFGTGFSSLSYLKNLPISTLKLDQSFVQGLPDDNYDAAIVETTMVMAHHLGLTVVAEGVETPVQRDFLKQHHCHLYQGFLYYPALDANGFTQLLAAQTSHHTDAELVRLNISQDAIAK